MRVAFHKLQTTKSPPGRCSHSATNVDNGVLILGGGRANDGSSNGQPAFVHFCDAWFLDPQDAQWRELTIDNPFTARRGHSALLHERQLVVFGGVADSGAGGPVERLIEGDQQLVVFDVDDAVTRLSRVSPDVSGAPPRPRRAHAAWLSGRTMIVYGGFMQTLQEIQEGVLDAIDAASALHALNLETWTWSRVDARPPMRPPAAAGGRDASEEWARRASRGVALAGCCSLKGAPMIVGGVSSTVGVGGGVGLLHLTGQGQWTMIRAAGSRHVVDGDAWTPRCSPACAAYGDRFVVLFGGSAVPQDINDAARDLNDVVLFDLAGPRALGRAPGWRAENRAPLHVALEDPRNEGVLTIVRCNATGAAEETLHTFEFLDDMSAVRAKFNQLSETGMATAGWLELRRGRLIELTTEWRVRTPTPSERNAASLTSIKTVGGEEVLVLFGGGVYPDTYYDDTHILHLEDLPAASAAPERPPPPLATICQATVARDITDENVFDMLMFADDRQLADLRTACLKHVQRRWSSNLRHWWHNAHHASPFPEKRPAGVPGADAALQAPSLRSDVERALRGI